jgi:hypothetical protein
LLAVKVKPKELPKMALDRGMANKIMVQEI